MSIKYTVRLSGKLQHLDGSFKWWLNRVLGDKEKGIPKITGMVYEYVDSISEASIVAKLVHQKVVNAKCGFSNLSCSMINPQSKHDTILFSLENWNGASKFQGNISDYRTYLINHEFLHCRPFFLDHPDEAKVTQICLKRSKTLKPLPIMYQQSRGSPGKYCKENPWPSKSDF
jgi:hypothetical protein